MLAVKLRRQIVTVCLALALASLAACSGPGAAGGQPASPTVPPAASPTVAHASTSTAGPTSATASGPASASPAASPAPAPAAPAASPAVPPPQPSAVPSVADASYICVGFPTGPESTRSLNANKPLCTYRDADGREIRLTAGRSSRGRDRGDFGWAHLRDKHLYGLWEAGGENTRFAEVGATSERDVLGLIGHALAGDPTPQREASGTLVYRTPIPGTGHAVQVVVGDSGRIITAYPVRERRR